MVDGWGSDHYFLPYGQSPPPLCGVLGLGFGFGLGLLLCFGVPFRFLGSLGAWFCLPNPTRMLKCCKIRYVLTFTNLISEDSQKSSGRGVGRVRCDALRQSAEGSTTESMGTVLYLKFLP